MTLTFKENLKRLVNAYGVSGDEFGVAQIAADILRPYVDRVEIDKFGNVTGYKSCGKPRAKKLMLDAHIDQIGFLVTDITKEGFLRFMGMGVDQRMLLGSELMVLPKGQEPIYGIVSCLPPHVQNGDYSKAIPIDEMYLDVGMSYEQVSQKVKVGDYMAFANDAIDLLNGCVCGKSMDDRACFMTIIHALDLLKDSDFGCDLIIVGSTKEEVGGHGARTRAYYDRPDYAIAIDVGHAQTADSTPMDRTHEFGGGPIIGIGANSIAKFARRMIEVARAKEIPHQIEAIPSASGTNAWSIQIVEEGVCTLVISLPLRYMHSPVELLTMTDVYNVGKLLCEFIKSFDGNL